MKPYRVTLLPGAKEDLRDIGNNITRRSSAVRATEVVARLRQQVESLEQLPNRGPRVRELAESAFSDARQLIEGPYRIIYEVDADEVVVHVIADGRRDMKTLLRERLPGV